MLQQCWNFGIVLVVKDATLAAGVRDLLGPRAPGLWERCGFWTAVPATNF